ncbi:DUF6799 domain-containing protein [Hymenobacter rubripertinctus]|uniref:DUF6799 domain-containing protein n=1 Tax=Hymenobacter rubripertinctus TaxID=2029981 RepID=A0A418QYF0_9BACT|nr:DUF6799 domain-containing protein [Hymenobacter rubripertinctus]RIY10216.1 hypothetical protein D0T11_10205 [Hymenobacter rubripertinctus]
MAQLSDFPRCLLLAAALLITAPTVLAQTSPGPAAIQLKDGAFRREGKVYRLQAGQQFPLTVPLRFDNGLTLRPDGIMVHKSGSRQLLENGKAINLQGDVVIYQDDMMTPAAIEQHDEQVTGGSTVVMQAPTAANLAALVPLLESTAQRLELLQQLSALLSERAGALADGASPPQELNTQITRLSEQLRP